MGLWRCKEVDRGVCGGQSVQRYAEGTWRGVQVCDWGCGRCVEVCRGAWRCAKGHRDRQRCTEVHRSMCKCWRDVWSSERCMELHVEMHEGGKWRYMEGWTKVYKGLYGGVQRYVGVSGGVNLLPLPTIDLVGCNREIEAYFEVLYPFLGG